ncbi:unnamed protein product [Calicophoron daubneyi]|uniref:Uncharacterized protein n=1 Tax=Calicophoron daubneyi TaxID=300641 RepID=A0AAV2TFD0_CALDB
MFGEDAAAEAQTNSLRNRGDSEDWFIHKADYREAPRQPRIRPESADIVKRNRSHLSTAALAGFADRPDRAEIDLVSNCGPMQAGERLRTKEARQNAHKSHETQEWHDFEGNLKYQPPPKPRRIGNSADGREIITHMNKRPDWFASSPNSLQRNGNDGRGDVRQKSSFNRRNEANNWFAHPTTQEEFDQLSVRQPRVLNRAEGIDYAVRNQSGTSDILYMTEQKSDSSAKVPYGCITKEAQRNARLANQGTGMSGCLHNGHSKAQEFESFTEQAPVARVRGCLAEELRRRNQDGYLGRSLHVETERGPSGELVTHSRTRPEATEYQEKSHESSQIADCLRTTNTGRAKTPDLDRSEQPKLRVITEEAEKAMIRNRGQMADYLGQGAQSVTKAYTKKNKVRGVPSSEAQEAAQKATGADVKELIYNQGLEPHPLHSAFGSLTEEARETAERNRKGLVGNLLGTANQRSSAVPLVGLEAPAPRRLRAEAVEYAIRNQGGEMGSLLRQDRT